MRNDHATVGLSQRRQATQFLVSLWFREFSHGVRELLDPCLLGFEEGTGLG
jgi:hypothetical protein